MRVVHLMATSGGGVVRHVADVAAAQRAAGLDVAVAAERATVGSLRELLARQGVEVPTHVVDLGDRPSPADLGNLLRLRRLLGGLGADVVHAHGVRAGAAAVIVDGVARRRGTPVVVTVHNGPPPARAAAAVFAGLERVCGRGSAAALVVSADLGARMIRAGARVVERALVPAPLPTAGRIPSTGEDEALADDDNDRVATLAVAARLAPQKAPHLVLDVVAALRASGRAVRAVLAGDGPLREELAAMVAARGLPVHLPGRVDDVPGLLAGADVVLLTSRWEGQPLVLQEALAVGAAIVATDVGGVAEVCGDAAVLVPWAAADGEHGPVAGLVEAVASVLDDPELALSLRARALVRASTLPTVADAVRQLDRVYVAAIAGRTGTPG